MAANISTFAGRVEFVYTGVSTGRAIDRARCEREGHRWSWKPPTKKSREHYRCSRCKAKSYDRTPRTQC